MASIIAFIRGVLSRWIIAVKVRSAAALMSWDNEFWLCAHFILWGLILLDAKIIKIDGHQSS